MSFEDRYNRWVDGLLPESERERFLQELAARGIPESEREVVRLGGEALRAAAPPLSHGEAFTEQVLDRIRRERAGRSGADVRRPAIFGWAWSGAGLVAVALAGFLAFIPKPWHPTRSGSEVYSVWSESDPGLSAVAVLTADRSGSVLWVEGLEYLPASHAVR